MWVNDEGCRSIVAESWSGAGIQKFADLARIVKRCGSKLKEWNKTNYGNLQSKISKLQRNLEAL